MIEPFAEPWYNELVYNNREAVIIDQNGRAKGRCPTMLDGPIIPFTLRVHVIILTGKDTPCLQKIS